MKIIKTTVLLLFIFLTSAHALNVPAKPTARVSDYAGVLSSSYEYVLEKVLMDYERYSSNQIAVAVFNSLEGESLDGFSIKLAEQWKIGQKDKDNGVIMLVFIKDRKIRIEVGYGLESVLTDAAASNIINTAITPYFRRSEYGSGILSGVQSIIGVVSPKYQFTSSTGSRSRVNTRTQSVSSSQRALLMFVAFIFIVAVFIDLVRYVIYSFGKRRNYSSLEWWASFAITLILLQVIMKILFYSAVLGGRGGGGYRGGGSGGFGGGGGSFGGGGSSGSW